MKRKCVYFIEAVDGGVVKIGTTKNVKSRISTLRVSSPFKLRLLGVIPGGHRCERRIHRVFKDYRASGEWFLFTPPVKQKISDLVEAAGDVPAWADESLARFLRLQKEYGLAI